VVASALSSPSSCSDDADSSSGQEQVRQSSSGRMTQPSARTNSTSRERALISGQEPCSTIERPNQESYREATSSTLSGLPLLRIRRRNGQATCLRSKDVLSLDLTRMTPQDMMRMPPSSLADEFNTVCYYIAWKLILTSTLDWSCFSGNLLELKSVLGLNVFFALLYKIISPQRLDISISQSHQRGTDQESILNEHETDECTMFQILS
jgi:hypothetical protein